MPRPTCAASSGWCATTAPNIAITYTETGLFGSYAVALRYLHSIGEPLRTR